MLNKKIEIIKDKLEKLYLYNKMSTCNIAKIYNCNQETIRRRLIECNINRRFHELKFKIPKKELENLYIEKKMSTVDIAKKYGCSQWTIRSNLLKYNINLRTPIEFLEWNGPGNQINPILISSPEISYILGVLLGDGWVYNYNHNYFIGLDNIEYTFCKSFLDVLKKIRLNPSIFRKGKYWRTLASSKLFYFWFNNLKFRDIKNIVSNYPIYFIRGFYESEGCLGINYDKRNNKKYLVITIVNSNKNIIKLTKTLIEKEGFNPRLNLRRLKPPLKPIWVLNLNRQKEINSFLKRIKPSIKIIKTKDL